MRLRAPNAGSGATIYDARTFGGARAWGAVAAVAVLAAGCSGDSEPDRAEGPVDDCDWPMWGHGVDRSFSSPCDTELSPETVGGLNQQWFFNAEDVVTATPAVVDDTVYVGDWSGRFFALDRETGEPRWTFDAEPAPAVYAGQIVSSAAVADVGDDRLVLFGGGRTVYALDTADGDEVWSFDVGRAADGSTEIESSPVVVDDTVIVGYDVHNTPGERAGMVALDAASGDLRWDFNPDLGGPQAAEESVDDELTGCVDVWGSPTVDVERGLVFAGTGNCNSSPEGWGPYTEALFALDLETGEPQWSYQPHEPNNDDFDFAGAPNLFAIGEQDVVGLGNKDAAYYAVDRETGELVWSRQATEPGLEEPGSNFSTGGFIGPTAYADGVVVGGTGFGPCPCLHAIDAETGDILWQNEDAADTFAASAEANGVVYVGGSDFTLRALDLQSGEVLWSQEMSGVVAGGAVVAGDDLFAVAGIRDPSVDEPSETSGVYHFSLDEPDPDSTTSAAPTTTAVPIAGFEARTGECFDGPCAMDILGTSPTPDPQVQVQVTPEPLGITITASNLGEPADWPRSPNLEASEYAAYISVRDDNPIGALLCVLDESLTCTAGTVPELADSFNRITVLAVDEVGTLPEPTEGAQRLVATRAFDPPLQVIPTD